MRLERLQITDYRNLERVDLGFDAPLAVLVGENAQGKSNLLEAIYMLATMRAIRAETDAQVIRRGALEDVLPNARIVASVTTNDGPLKIEITLVGRTGANGLVASKTVKVNGVPKRMSDAVGRITAVLFTAEDLDMVTGSPSNRRRYLDVLLGQVDPQYAAARSRYERVLTQRNSLLKRIREGIARQDELQFWDDEIVRDGGVVFHRRSTALTPISQYAREAHAQLAPGEVLEVRYRPRIDGEIEGGSTEAEISDAYARALARTTVRDIGAGMTLTGPHRDDVEFSLDGFAAAGFASRAQQRTIALSLRLAETRLLRERRGESPVLLLDDILSEMDAARRASVLAAIGDVEQMMVTGTDWDRFPGAFVAGARLYGVEGGSVQPLDPAAHGPKTAGP